MTVERLAVAIIEVQCVYIALYVTAKYLLIFSARRDEIDGYFGAATTDRELFLEGSDDLIDLNSSKR
jgi:hypothetical protein